MHFLSIVNSFVTNISLLLTKSIPENYSNEKVLNILLYGSIRLATIRFLKISERFNGPRFDHS